MNVHKGRSYLFSFFRHNCLQPLDSFIINDLKKRADLMGEDKWKRDNVTSPRVFGKTNELGDKMKLAQPLDR